MKFEIEDQRKDPAVILEKIKNTALGSAMRPMRGMFSVVETKR